MWAQFLSQDLLEEGMLTHSSVLAWRIKTEKPGGLWFRESDVAEATEHTHMNIGVHVSFWVTIFSGYMPRSETAGLYVCYCCLVTKLCPTLCDPVSYSPSCSSVHGISQAKILEWVSISSSRGSSWSRDWTHVSCIGRWVLYHWATREAVYVESKKKKKKSDTYELILQNRNMYFTKQKYVYSQTNKTNLCLPKWVSGEGGEIK